MRLNLVFGLFVGLSVMTVTIAHTGGELDQSGVATKPAATVEAKTLSTSRALTSSEKKLQDSVRTGDLRRICLIKKQSTDLSSKLEELLKALETSKYVYEGI